MSPPPTGLAWFNELPAAQAQEQLMRCCASPEFAEAVAAGRPYPDLATLLEAADAAWSALDGSQWLSAIQAHPRIGDRPAGAEHAWARDEQAGAGTAPLNVTEQLAAGNAEYERRFGHVFLIRAAGRTAEEMLAALRVRLAHSADEELAVAAGQQSEITRLRLQRLLQEQP